MLPSPLPESNYYVVFTKANSPSDPYVPKTRLPPLSGTLSSRHRSIPLQDLILPHRNYLHRSPLDDERVWSVIFCQQKEGLCCFVTLCELSSR